MDGHREHRPIALEADALAPRAKKSFLPEPFASRLTGREKRALGDGFGLRNFGVNLTRIEPGGISSLHHRHSRQDELIYILEGEPVLVTDDGETRLRPGMCAGFPAGGTAHHLENRTDRAVVYLEVGDRAADDEVTYPHEDLKVVSLPDGTRRAAHKDGTPY
jgi:uncharacterized cupin superfamily protein